MGEEVVDSEGNAIGNLACHWEYEPDTPMFLGINLDDTSTRTHVIPVNSAKLNIKQSYVQIAISKDTVAHSPCLDCGSELDRSFEKQVNAYYGLEAPVENRPSELKRILRSDVAQPNESDTAIL